jgi:Secretion system C-terminal sorting domain
MRIFFILIQITVFTVAFAQQSLTYTQVARNENYGGVQGIAVSDSIVFTANGGGLRAYNYIGNSFNHLGYINDGGEAKDVAITSNGTILLANGRDGLRAYTFDGSKFNHQAYLEYRPSLYFDDGALDIAVNSQDMVYVNFNGNLEVYSFENNSFHYNRTLLDADIQDIVISPQDIVFVAAGYDGLYVFYNEYYDSTHINNGGEALDVAVSPNGTIFLANGIDGIRAYTYDGTSITNTAHEGSYQYPQRITATTDSTVVISNRYGDLVAYSYVDTSFVLISSIIEKYAYDIESISDSLIFLANNYFGLRSYNFDGSSFINFKDVSDGGSANGISFFSDSTILLANGGGGLRAYNFNGTSFNTIGHTLDGNVYKVAIAPDSTVFVITYDGELRAYKYDIANLSFINTAYIKILNSYEELRLNAISVTSDSTVFITYFGMGGLSAYKYTGTEFKRSDTAFESGLVGRDLAVLSDSIVFLANDSDGLRVYKYNGASLDNIVHVDDGGTASGVAIRADSTIFLANEYDGLRAYKFDGDSLIKIAHLNDINATDITISPEGIVYIVSNHSKLWAYSFDVDSFKIISQIDKTTGYYSRDIAISPNGTVYWAQGEKGLSAYTKSGAVGIHSENPSQPGQFTLSQNYPNPFNPQTSIEFSVPQKERVRITLFDISGKKVKTLLDENKQSGSYKTTFNLSDLASGLYLYRLQAGTVSLTKKLVLLK